jgi:two-component system NtrC family response regulator
VENLLIVDDNEDIRTQLRWGFSKDYKVSLAGDAAEALALLGKSQPRVVMLDLGLPPDENGVEEGINCLNLMLERAPYTRSVRYSLGPMIIFRSRLILTACELSCPGRFV